MSRRADEVGPRAPAPAATGRFVGREHELAELEAGLRSAVGGRGRLLLVTGEPGIGKSRLADEFSIRAEASGALVLWASCWEGGGAPEFWPWIQVIRSLTRHLGARDVAERLGEAVERFAPLLPELRPHVMTPAPRDDARAALFTLFDSVMALLRHAASERPAVIVFDDLHAADRSSLVLLRFVAGELRTARLLLVGTYRDVEARLLGDAGELLDGAARHGRTLALLGLSEDEVRELVSEAMGGRATTERVAAAYQGTEGNPLFVTEIVRLLPGRDEDRFDLPPRVRDTIRRRLDLLDADQLDTLRVAATIGKDFDVALLRSAAGIEAETASDRLQRAADVGIARPAGPHRWSFTHGLYREVVLEDLAPDVQARLHADVGASMERIHARTHAPPLAELAHHFALAAGVVGSQKAVTYSLRAGERALRALAYHEAVEHFERALGFIPLDDDAQRIACLLALGDARARAGTVAAARDAVEQAVRIARSTGDPDRLAEAALALGELNLGEVWTRPWVPDAHLVSVLDEAVAALGGADSALSARATALLAASLHFSARKEEAATLSERALAAAERLGDPATLAYCLGARHLAAWGPGNLEERLAIATDLVRLAHEVGNTDLHLQARVWRMADLLEAGRIADADEEVEAYARIAEASRRPQLRAYVAFLRAQRAIFDGNLDVADPLAAEAYGLAEQVGDENILGSYWCLILPMRAWQGHLDEVESGYRHAYARYAPNIGWRLALCWMCARLGRGEEARQLLDGVVDEGMPSLPRDAYFLGMLPFLAEACARLHDARAAAVVLETYRPFTDRHVIAGRDGVCLYGSAARQLGMLAATAGDLDDATALFEHALAANLRMGSRPWLAETQLEYARALVERDRSGDRDRARGFLDAAAATARALRLPGLLAEVEAVAAGDAAGFVGTNVFRLEGEYWTLGFAGRSVRLRDAKGLRDLAHLLAAPDREIHVADLIASTDGLPERSPVPGRGELTIGAEAGEPLLDAKARTAYRARLTELQDDLTEAERHNDPERAARAREEMDFIAGELAAALGLGGRPRRAGDPSERARKAVAQRIRNALRRIDRVHPDLAAHLDRSIRTGRFCSYRPERATIWSL